MSASKYTAVVTSSEPERVFPPLMLAMGARAMEMDAVLFFTLSGLKAIMKGEAEGISLGSYNLAEMVRQAQELGVRMVACSTALELMGISADALIDGVEVGGVATYLSEAAENAITHAF